MSRSEDEEGEGEEGAWLLVKWVQCLKRSSNLSNGMEEERVTLGGDSAAPQEEFGKRSASRSDRELFFFSGQRLDSHRK